MKYYRSKREDYDKLYEIWEESVQNTHSFVKPDDKNKIKDYVREMFEAYETYTWEDNGNIIGFTYVQDSVLEALFIDYSYIYQGYGSQIMKLLLSDFKVNSLQVNKENDNTIKFYQKHGFIVVGEEVDEFGYVLLNMELK